MVQNSKNQSLEERSNNSYDQIEKMYMYEPENTTFFDYVKGGASVTAHIAILPAICAPFIGGAIDVGNLMFTKYPTYEETGMYFVGGTAIMGALIIGAPIVGAALGAVYGAGKKTIDGIIECYENISNLELPKDHRQEQYCLKMFD